VPRAGEEGARAGRVEGSQVQTLDAIRMLHAGMCRGSCV
jgi:hypothetical protein